MAIAWRKHADGSLGGQVGRYVRLSVKKEKGPGGGPEGWTAQFHIALHPAPGEPFQTQEQACAAIEAFVREALRETFRAAKETWPKVHKV